VTESEENRAAQAAVETAAQQRERVMKEREQAYANSPRYRSHWGKGLEGQRLPGYLVSVTERTRHDTAGRHTFVLDPYYDDTQEPGGPRWHRYSGRPTTAVQAGVSPWAGVPYESLPDLVHLAQGVDIRATTLVIIFEALVSRARHRIDLVDIHRIVSDPELGSFLMRLHALPVQQRRLAEPALYTKILSRCTTL